MVSTTITIINYSLRIQTPIHIGCGMRIGALRLTHYRYIPGYTLRGLIGRSLAMITCSKNIINCQKCREMSNCLYYQLIRSSEHAKVAYFHPADLPRNLQKKVFTRIAINRKTKIVILESTFSYEALISSRGYIDISSKIVLLGDRRSEAKVIANAIRSLRGMGLGGRRSWGWGYIESSYMHGIEVQNKSENTNKLCITLKTPIPLESGYVFKDLRQAIIDTLKSFNISPQTLRFSLSTFVIRTITHWDETQAPNGKPLRQPALSEGTTIKIEGNYESVSALALAFQYTGVSQNKKWYTGAGFGLAHVKYI